MSRIASRLSELGVTLPLPMQAPGDIKLPFNIAVELEAELLLR